MILNILTIFKYFDYSFEIIDLLKGMPAPKIIFYDFVNLTIDLLYNVMKNVFMIFVEFFRIKY